MRAKDITAGEAYADRWGRMIVAASTGRYVRVESGGFGTPKVIRRWRDNDGAVWGILAVVGAGTRVQPGEDVLRECATRAALNARAKLPDGVGAVVVRPADVVCTWAEAEEEAARQRARQEAAQDAAREQAARRAATVARIRGMLHRVPLLCGDAPETITVTPEQLEAMLLDVSQSADGRVRGGDGR